MSVKFRRPNRHDTRIEDCDRELTRLSGALRRGKLDRSHVMEFCDEWLARRYEITVSSLALAATASTSKPKKKSKTA